MPVAALLGYLFLEDSHAWFAVQAFLRQFLGVVHYRLRVVRAIRTPGVRRGTVVVGGPSRRERGSVVRQDRDLQLAVGGAPRASRAECSRQRLANRGCR